MIALWMLIWLPSDIHIAKRLAACMYAKQLYPEVDSCVCPSRHYAGLSGHLLQDAYKQELQQAYGISFNSLLCLNNMPIKRYADHLVRHGQLQEYMQVPLCAALLQPLLVCVALEHPQNVPGEDSRRLVRMLVNALPASLLAGAGGP